MCTKAVLLLAWRKIAEPVSGAKKVIVVFKNRINSPNVPKICLTN